MLNFAAFAFISSVTPGPNNSMLMASGLKFGVRRTLPHLLGINIGFGLMFLGVGLILPFMPEGSMTVLQWIANALLCYIAFKIATAPVDFNEVESTEKPWGFFKAFAFQWINPKGLMMAFAGATSFGLDTITATIVFMLMNIFCGIWIFAGVGLRRFLIGNPERTRLLYVTLAAILVISMIMA